MVQRFRIAAAPLHCCTVLLISILRKSSFPPLFEVRGILWRAKNSVLSLESTFCKLILPSNLQCLIFNAKIDRFCTHKILYSAWTTDSLCINVWMKSWDCAEETVVKYMHAYVKHLLQTKFAIRMHNSCYWRSTDESES